MCSSDLCKERIPLRYPIVELATAVAFGVAIAMFGATQHGVKLCLFSAIMIDLIATDFEERILPDEFTLGGTVLGLVLAWFVPLADGVMSMLLVLQGIEASPQVLSLIEAGFAGVFCAGMLWAVAWIFEKVRHKEGMGMGDIKMMLLIGSFLGLESSLFTFFVASLVGSVAGVLFIWLAKKEAATYELPFGSFLGAVAIGVAFWMR